MNIECENAFANYLAGAAPLAAAGITAVVPEATPFTLTTTADALTGAQLFAVAAVGSLAQGYSVTGDGLAPDSAVLTVPTQTSFTLNASALADIPAGSNFTVIPDQPDPAFSALPPQTAFIMPGLVFGVIPNARQSVVICLPKIDHETGRYWYGRLTVIVSTPGKGPDGFTRAMHAKLQNAVQSALFWDSDDVNAAAKDAALDAAFNAAAPGYAQSGFFLKSVEEAEPENMMQTTFTADYGIVSPATS